MTAWKDGELTERNSIVVPVGAHCVGRGSAIFEVMDIISTAGGPALFRGTDHVDRLFRSAEILTMPLPMDKDRIVEGMKDLARSSGLDRGCIKLIAYYCNEDFGVVPSDPAVSIAAFVHTIEGSVGKSYEECILPATSGISSIRKLSNRSTNPHVKVAGHYVNAFFANREAREKGYAVPILLDNNGMVMESSTANLFMVKDGALVTATTEGVLKGITRDSVLRIAAELGVPREERNYTAQELLSADEAFISGSVIRIQPIKSINERALGSGGAGPVTTRLMDIIEAVYRGEDERFADWVEMV